MNIQPISPKNNSNNKGEISSNWIDKLYNLNKLSMWDTHINKNYNPQRQLASKVQTYFIVSLTNHQLW
jgi:hypothetical protein